MLLLCILLFAFTLPDIAVFSVHPASFVLLAAYLFTLKLLVDTHENPTWLPRMARGTVSESSRKQGAGGSREKSKLIADFVVCAAAVGIAGWMIAASGIDIAARTGLSDGIMGGLFIAVITSLPELVIAITAIRLGSLTLAVGDIVGGNAFDTLFIAVSDFFYREGPIYAGVEPAEKVWLATAMLMNAVLLLGLIYRERKGIANIGMESTLILVIYVGAVLYFLI